MEFYFQSNSVMNSFKCPKSKSLSRYLIEFFPIYQNKHWTIRRQDDCSIDPSSHHIILKIIGFLLSREIGGPLQPNGPHIYHGNYCLVLLFSTEILQFFSNDAQHFSWQSKYKWTFYLRLTLPTKSVMYLD